MAEEFTDEEQKVIGTRAKQLLQLHEDYYKHEIFNIKAELEFMVYLEMLRVIPSTIILDTDFLDRELTDILSRELTALNSELYGLAWLDYNYKLLEEGKQGENQCDLALCSEIMFARSYLEKPLSDIWNAAGFYNATIFQARMAQRISRDWSVPRDSGYYMREISQPVEEEVGLLLKIIREHFDELLKDKVSGKECSLRLSNRLVSIHSWRDGIMISQKLSSAFAERLSLTPNSETIFLLQRLTVGLYRNARDYINAVKDYGSWELARKATNDFRQVILKAGYELLEKQKGSQ